MADVPLPHFAPSDVNVWVQDPNGKFVALPVEVSALVRTHAAAVTAAKDAEIARLTAQLEAVRKWQERGESLLLGRSEGVPVWFHLGAWWADRPWRDVPRISNED